MDRVIIECYVDIQNGYARYELMDGHKEFIKEQIRKVMKSCLAQKSKGRPITADGGPTD